MLVALVGERTGWHVGRLADVLGRRGHRVEVVPWRSVGATVGPGDAGITPGPLRHADVVAVRGMPGSAPEPHRLEQVIFRMDALARLAAGGVPVVNPPRSLEIAIDKFLTLAVLADAGIPVPRTAVVQDGEAARAAWNALGGDCVAKPIFGSRGRGLLRVTTAAQAASAADAGIAYLQEFIPHPDGDLRILLAGDDAFAMRRVAAAGEWRTNLSCGGRPEPAEASPAAVDLARRAAAAVGARIVGVDLLPTPDGPLVVEVNAVPAWRGLQTVSTRDPAEAVAAELERSARRMTASDG